MRRRLALFLTAGSAAITVCLGQSSSPAPRFEVASIKPCNAADAPRGGGRGGSRSPSSDRISLQCETVFNLIRIAYIYYANGEVSPPLDLPPIEGGPAWIHSERYTIEAKSETPQKRGMMAGPMLQQLLEDRFKLKMHRESKEIPVYALTVAKNGPKLHTFQPGSCVDIGLVAGRANAPAAPEARQTRIICGANHGTRTGTNVTLEITGLNMAHFVKLLSNTGRPVIDKTGITGLFDIHLEFAQEPQQQQLALQKEPRAAPVAAGPDSPAAVLDPAGHSIFTALQQQLGLKLEPARGPHDFLVIDSVNRPSEN